MSLRRRLFFLLGGLVCLLLLGQWLLYRSLTRAVTDDVRTVAFRVGSEILSGFSYRLEGAAEDIAAADDDVTQAHVVIVTSGVEGAPNPASGIDLPGAEPKRLTVTREIHVQRSGAAGAGASSGGTFETGSAAVAGATAPPGPLLRKIVLETDAARDVLFVRGPAIERAIPIPHAAIASTLDRFGSRLLLGNLALLAVGLAAAAVVAHRLTRPLAGLTAAAERLGSGELGAAVAVRRGERAERDDEIGRAIAAFNRMSQRLADLDRENRRLVAVEQLSELGEVARGLAHSLRNPLNALGLAIDQLGASDEAVEGSRRQIRRMDGALRSFLALASAGAAQAERVDLAQLAREVALEALQDGAGRVHIEVEAAAPAGPAADLAVEGVPAELKAALQALVVNAVEASAPGGRVTIRVERAEQGGVRMAIEDAGPGLPEAVRARLFEPHVTTKPHGSGMGLFLAQRLIAGRYAGQLRLEPRPSGGIRATLEFADRVGGRDSGR